MLSCLFVLWRTTAQGRPLVVKAAHAYLSPELAHAGCCQTCARRAGAHVHNIVYLTRLRNPPRMLHLAASLLQAASLAQWQPPETETDKFRDGPGRHAWLRCYADHACVPAAEPSFGRHAPAKCSTAVCCTHIWGAQEQHALLPGSSIHRALHVGPPLPVAAECWVRGPRARLASWTPPAQAGPAQCR